VAGQLRLRTSQADDIGFWIDTLNQKRDLLKDTMGALWWSYHQLEEHVQQCFAYCSMFPRRYVLNRDKLVKMWMAQGFGDTSKNSDMEVAARECFEVLLSTSFIQLKYKTDDQREYYTVHDLLHDLAGRVAGSDCFTIEKDMVDHQIPQDVRHLFIDSNNLGKKLIEQIVKLDSLRTLLMSSSGTKITAEEFKRMLKHLKKLRFVSVWLEKFGANVIPECIGELKHLRYLGLTEYEYSDSIIDLPPAFTKLYHLQEISVPRFRCLDSNHIADLENLRHIGYLEVSIPDIGRMPWLQTMSAFTVKREKGYEITQLEKLDNIRGKLSIEGLGNIQSKEDARRAKLSNKLHVSELTLDWNPNEETESSKRKRQKTAGHRQQKVTPEQILEALHPPALLVQLTIANYGGSTFPSWLSGEDGKLKHLQRLIFHGCNGSGSQLKFSKPLPELHRLYINFCSWYALPDNIEQLASLKELIIDCCDIQSLPGLPSSLKYLEIEACPNILTLPELLPSLEELIIIHCRNIKSLPGLPSSLKVLRIKEYCPNICTLPELPQSLEGLEVVDCPNIKSLPGLPSFLKELECEQYLVDSYPDRQAIDQIKKKSFL
jgi:Leucine-rich repeat (LRR) protein